MIISRTDAVMSGNCKTPKGLYHVRCLQATFVEKNKSSGNPMTDLLCEVVSPEQVEHEDVTYNLAGQKFHLRIVHKADAIETTFQFMDKLGIEHNNEYDTKKINDYFRGVGFDIVLTSQEQVARYDATGDEKVGKPILDGEGAEISNGWQIQAWANEVPLNANPDKVDLGPY